MGKDFFDESQKGQKSRLEDAASLAGYIMMVTMVLGNPTIYIHIGTHKTGSSAIQDFLALNKKKLGEKRFLFIQKSRRAYYEKIDGKFVVAPSQYKYYRKIVNLCRRKNMNAILSSETFSWVANISALQSVLCDVNVKIICYLRRQDSLIQSLYNQAVKDGLFYRNIEDYKYRYLDYCQFINRWASVFGKENILVRPYEKRQLKNNDIIEDFFSLLGLELTDEFISLEKNPNPRLSIETMQYMRYLNALLSDRKKAKRFKKCLVAYSVAKYKEESDSVFSSHSLLMPEHRISILEKYEESNTRVAIEYLNRPDGRLFLEEWPEISPSLQRPPELKEEDILDITRHVCRIHKKSLLKALQQQADDADEFTLTARKKLMDAVKALGYM